MTKFSNQENLRMPAEWEKQKSTWIAWPHNDKDWPNKFNLIPEIFAKIVFHISKSQIVNILVENNSLKKSAVLILKDFKVNFSNIKFISLFFSGFFEVLSFNSLEINSIADREYLRFCNL